MLVALKNYDQLPAGVIGLYAKKQDDETWTIAAWTNTSYEEIILYLAEVNGQSVVDTAFALGDLPLDWTLLNDPVVVGVAPLPFNNGLIDGDPLVPVLDQSDDPMLTLEILEFLGYPAVSKISIASPSVGGTLPIDPDPWPGECLQISAGDWFDILESSFESEIAIPASGWDVFDGFFAQLCVCWPRTWVVSSNSTPWSCGGWQIVNQGLNSEFQRCFWNYTRLATKVDTRTIIRRDISCNVSICNQTRACSSDQVATCTSPAQPTMPPGGTCEGVPACTPSGACGPGSLVVCNDWFPSCP